VFPIEIGRVPFCRATQDICAARDMHDLENLSRELDPVVAEAAKVVRQDNA
jgi:hypothetical protein